MRMHKWTRLDQDRPNRRRLPSPDPNANPESGYEPEPGIRMRTRDPNTKPSPDPNANPMSGYERYRPVRKVTF